MSKEKVTKEMLASLGLEPSDSRMLDVAVSDLYDAGYRKQTGKRVKTADRVVLYAFSAVYLSVFLLAYFLG